MALINLLKSLTDYTVIKDGEDFILKKKKSKPARSWEEFCADHTIQEGEAYIGYGSTIDVYDNIFLRNSTADRNVCSSKEEAEAFLALMQLRQLRKAWVEDWEQPDSNDTMAVIVYDKNKQRIKVDFGYCWRNSVLSFPTRKMAEDFLNCFRDLCEKAKKLL